MKRFVILPLGLLALAIALLGTTLFSADAHAQPADDPPTMTWVACGESSAPIDLSGHVIEVGPFATHDDAVDWGNDDTLFDAEVWLYMETQLLHLFCQTCEGRGCWHVPEANEPFVDAYVFENPDGTWRIELHFAPGASVWLNCTPCEDSRDD